MTREKIYREAAIYLERIAEGMMPGYTNVGLCHNLHKYMLGMFDVDCGLDIYFFDQWPLCSENVVYPVSYEGDPIAEYDTCENKYVGAYGKLRRELAQFLADHIVAALEIYEGCDD